MPEFADVPNYCELDAEDRVKRLQSALRTAQELASQKASASKVRTDRTAERKNIPVGANVLAHFPRSTFARKQGNAKFARQWRPYVVELQIGPVTYLVRPREGGQCSVFHADRLKLIKERSVDDDFPEENYESTAELDSSAEEEEQLDYLPRAGPDASQVPGQHTACRVTYYGGDNARLRLLMILIGTP